MTKELQMIVVAAVVFVLITAGLAWWGMTLSDEVAIQRSTLQQLETEIAAAQKEIDRKGALEEEQKALDKHLARYVTILPPPEVASKEWFLRVVQEKCERSQLTTKEIEFVEDRAAAQKPAGPGAKAAAAFEEVKVNLVASATYDEFLRFLNSIERHETFLRVNTFDCKLDGDPVGDEEGNLTWPLEIRLQISTYRYTAAAVKK